MSFRITFKANKPGRPANDNIHDEAAWQFAHDWAETGWPVNLWPRQYAVHYIYELVNKPWLPVRARSDNMLAWTHQHHETHSPNA